MKKFLDIAGNISIVIAILAVLLFASSVFGPKLKIYTFAIRSGSMEPTIKYGSWVVYKAQNDYQKNDIIAFRKSGEVVTHRIIDIQEKEGKISYITKGDANKVQDIFPTEKESVIGKLIFPIAFLGYLVLFAKSKIGVIVIILIPAILIITTEGMKIKKQLENKKHQKTT